MTNAKLDHEFVVKCLDIQFGMAICIRDYLQRDVYIFDKSDMFNCAEVKTYKGTRYVYNSNLDVYGVLSGTAQAVFGTTNGNHFDEPHYMGLCKETGVRGIRPDSKGIYIQYVPKSEVTK